MGRHGPTRRLRSQARRVRGACPAPGGIWARAELEERFGDDPSPFETTCLVNLALACGDIATTRRLLDSLASGPQFLHDFALNHAEQLGARMELANGEEEDPVLKRFLDDVTAVYCGLAPALGTGDAAPPEDPAEGDDEER